MITWLQDRFPNLQDIRISLDSIHSRNRTLYKGIGVPFKQFITMLGNYRNIIIVDDISDPLPETNYRELFPENLRDKIIFEESDWM